MATFRLATRGSTLAMIQARLAVEALAGRYPEHEFILVPLATHGDRQPRLRLADSPREGVFVKDLEQALLDGRAELAVHSAKDLPTLPTPGLVLAGFLERADARDVLIARPPSTLAQLPPGSRLGTGSPRRAAQIAAIRPDLRAVEIRGNVDTRLRRLAEGAVDALILAAAGLERLRPAPAAARRGRAAHRIARHGDAFGRSGGQSHPGSGSGGGDHRCLPGHRDRTDRRGGRPAGSARWLRLGRVYQRERRRPAVGAAPASRSRFPDTYKGCCDRATDGGPAARSWPRSRARARSLHRRGARRRIGRGDDPTCSNPAGAGGRRPRRPPRPAARGRGSG